MYAYVIYFAGRVNALMCCLFLALHADYRIFAKDVIAGAEKATVGTNIPASAIICIQEG